jgi:cysteinyl-tRNA synthetase
MVLKLYNTLARDLAPVTAPPERPLSIYACGPTVYDYAHIGNLRTFVTNDLLRRTLEYLGQEVELVMNITDVDDKTIAGARAAGETLTDFTRRYEDYFLADLAALNVKTPAAKPRATEHVPTMIALIEKLLANGRAYPADDGVYFSIARFPSYGKLSGRTETEGETEASRDFALWKFWKEEDGETAWEAPFGKGRPGWHIECSAMIADLIGPTVDIHTGATDLIFPHHENEIAQSESVYAAPLARHWLHGAFLLVEGQKMSKSLGNVFTLRDLENRGFSSLDYRYWLLTAHYRTQANFTWEALAGAQTARGRLNDAFLDLDSGIGQADESYRAKFHDFISDDLNFPQAVALIWQLLADSSLTPDVQRATLLDFDRVLGLGLAELKPPTIPPEIQNLLVEREAARKARDFATADALRAQIETAGFTIEDTEKGQKIRVK